MEKGEKNMGKWSWCERSGTESLEVLQQTFLSFTGAVPVPRGLSAHVAVNWAGIATSAISWNLKQNKPKNLITVPRFCFNSQQPWTSGLGKARCPQTSCCCLQPCEAKALIQAGRKQRTGMPGMLCPPWVFLPLGLARLGNTSQGILQTRAQSLLLGGVVSLV